MMGNLSLNRGVVTFEQFLGHFEHILADDSIRPGYHTLLDLRNANPSEITHDQILMLAKHFAAVDHEKGCIKKALISCEAKSFEQSQIYESGMCASGVRTITFTSLTVACAWLNVDLDVVENAIAKLHHQFLQRNRQADDDLKTIETV
jgi:hypothetical protein